jgi:hypothetical protein
MRPLSTTVLFLLLCSGCHTQANEGKASIATTEKVSAPEAEHKAYEAFLKEVAAQRAELKGKPVSEAADYIHHLVSEDIAAYWTGTPWDFNGTTRTPGKGAIACGYFITNVLSDLGFKIQRVKLAQQASSQMIQTLTVNIGRLASIAALKAYLAKQKDNSVFIIGLDFHTGFMIKTGEKYEFLHANYIGREGVVKENIDHSRALQASKSFMIGNLTANKSLLQQWVDK